MPRLPPPSCARPVSGVGLGPSYYPASLLWSPGPRPSPVFRSAICDCLSLNVSISRPRIYLQCTQSNRDDPPSLVARASHERAPARVASFLHGLLEEWRALEEHPEITFINPHEPLWFRNSARECGLNLGSLMAGVRAAYGEGSVLVHSVPVFVILVPAFCTEEAGLFVTCCKRSVRLRCNSFEHCPLNTPRIILVCSLFCECLSHGVIQTRPPLSRSPREQRGHLNAATRTPPPPPRGLSLRRAEKRAVAVEIEPRLHLVEALLHAAPVLRARAAAMRSGPLPPVQSGHVSSIPPY